MYGPGCQLPSSQMPIPAFSVRAGGSVRPSFFSEETRLIVGILAVSLACYSSAQVPNGDFETHTDCPTLTGQIDLAAGWYSPTMGTPDFFHACGSAQAGVPANLFGNEPAHSGSAYSGLIIKNSSPSLEWREYMQIELTGPLLTGVLYELRMQVSLAEYSQFGSSAIGGLLTTVPITRPDNFRFNLPPQATNPIANPVLNKDGWVLLTMPFLADSAHRYLTIGNFLDDAHTSGIPVGGGMQPRAYFYIDDVALSIAPNLQILGDRSICVGDSTTLSALNTSTHAWADSLTPSAIISTASSITVSPTTTTTYALFGSTDTAYATVTVHPYPTVHLGNDTTLCEGEALTLDATTTNASYLWQDSSSDPAFTVHAPGTYWAQLTVNGCAASDTIQVNYIPIPLFDLGNDTLLCQGASIMLDATTPGASYVWSDNSTGATLLVDQEGTYWATVTVNGCSTTDSIRVDHQPLPTIDPGPDPILCRGGTLLLDATTANGSYLWQDGSTDPTFTVQEEGSYSVAVTANGCTATASIFIAEEECSGTLMMPNVFSPNSDGRNDLFIPVSFRGILSMHTTIRNRWGQVIFETNLPSIRWNGKDAPDGTYFWTVNYVDVNGNEKRAAGYVMLLR